MLDVRKMLYSYKKLEVGLQNIERSLQNLSVMKEYPSGVASYSDMPKGSQNSSTTERFAIKNIDQVNEFDLRKLQLESDRQAYEEALHLIRSALDTLHQEESELIRLRYFQGLRMSKVALVMGISNRLATFHHANALRSVEQCLNSGKLNLRLNWFEKKEAPAG